MTSNENITIAENPILQQLKIEIRKIVQKELLTFSNVVNHSFQRIENQIKDLESKIQSIATDQRTSRKKSSIQPFNKNHCWYHQKFGIFATDCPPNKSCSFIMDTTGVPPDNQTCNNRDDDTTTNENNPRKRSLAATMDELFGPMSPSPKKWNRRPQVDD